MSYKANVENPKKQTLQLNRRKSTQLARWKSGHLRPLVYKEGTKSFPMCTRCKTEEATPQNCIGKDKRSLYREPRRVLELLNEHDLQDLVIVQVKTSHTRRKPVLDTKCKVKPHICHFHRILQILTFDITAGQWAVHQTKLAQGTVQNGFQHIVEGLGTSLEWAGHRPSQNIPHQEEASSDTKCKVKPHICHFHRILQILTFDITAGQWAVHQTKLAQGTVQNGFQHIVEGLGTSLEWAGQWAVHQTKLAQGTVQNGFQHIVEGLGTSLEWAGVLHVLEHDPYSWRTFLSINRKFGSKEIKLSLHTGTDFLKELNDRRFQTLSLELIPDFDLFQVFFQQEEAGNTESRRAEFDGSTVPIKKWLQEIDDNAIIFGWTDLHTLVVAKMLLTGVAKLWLRSQPTFSTWPELKEAITNEFDNPIDSRNIHILLTKRKKQQFESHYEYFLNMREPYYMALHPIQTLKLN
ncbi:transposition [Cordylochernes scorpioides]|uniref:Transposition n=1 Tax=Cordylochernes scorpioides TaxID=51811 RepID=A0ABY6L3S4_9ARAC|nr:transposition [Cordylochernes scorpioides]